MQTLYEDSAILVRTNGSGEIFYCYKDSGAEIRISGNLILAWNGFMVPTSHNGLSGMMMKNPPQGENA